MLNSVLYIILNFNLLNLLPLFFSFLAIYAIYDIVRYFYLKRSYLHRKSVFLEIIAPKVSLVSSVATDELFTMLHAIGSQDRSKFSFLKFAPKVIYSFEMVSTRKGGIRYIAQVGEDKEDLVRNIFVSYMPGVKINKIEDPLTKDLEGSYSFAEMGLKNDFSFPLDIKTDFSKHDPISYITGHMAKIKNNEEIVFVQLILSPVFERTRGYISRKIRRVRNKAINSERIPEVFTSRPISYIYYFLFYLPIEITLWLLFWVLNMLFLPFTFVLYVVTIGHSRIFLLNSHKKVRLSDLNGRVYRDITEKLNKELFEVSLRFYVKCADMKETESRMKGLVSSLATFSNEQYQSFVLKGMGRRGLLDMKNRLLSFGINPVLSVSEISSLYHFPYTLTTKTEDIVKSKSKDLPLDLSVKNEDNFDNAFAMGSDGNKVGLTREERARHVYILGATGTGKSTLLLNMIMHDIVEGKGVCVIDPHGDLAEDILKYIPRERVQDTIYLNPSDIVHPVGINLLEIPKTLNEDEMAREKDLIASGMISLFSRLYPPRFMGPRMENILRNAVLTVLELKDPTLFLLQRILIDSKYRKVVIENLKDPVLKLFWTKEFQGLGSYQKAQAVSPITSKIGRFITSPYLRYILGQAHSTIDFDKVINEGKVLICNLSKGRIGEDVSALIGGIVTAKFELSAFRRVDILEEKRKDFYIFIDEFQNFATESFVQILSEARKYHLSLTLAHQTTAQVDDKDLLRVILANVGTLIGFRTGSAQDENILLPYFAPEVSTLDISNLSNHKFFIKINAVSPKDTFSGETVMYKGKGSNLKDMIIKESLSRYTIKRESVEEMISEIFEDVQYRKRVIPQKERDTILPR